MNEDLKLRPYHCITHLKRTLLFFALVGVAITFACLPQWAAAEAGGQEQSAEAVARDLANPNSSLASLTFKNQYRWYTGDLPGADDQDNYTMVFQPVFPLKLPEGSNGGQRTLFIRPGFPLLFDQPVPRVANGGLDWDRKSALGDIGFDIGYGVSEKSGFLWALGMVGTLPTATDSDLAGKQLRLGPEFLLAKFEKWGVYGIFPSHQWNVAGWSDETFSTTQIQPVLKFLLGDGWAAGSSPIGNYNRVDHPDQPECFQDSFPRQDALEVRTGSQLLRRATGCLRAASDDRPEHHTRRQQPFPARL